MKYRKKFKNQENKRMRKLRNVYAFTGYYKANLV